MKVVITGSTGFLATEVLQQALQHPKITTIIALARSPVTPPPTTTAEQLKKLKCVVVKDYGTYEADVKKELEGADACIWTVAITPTKARALPAAQVKTVCQDWTVAGMQAFLDATPTRTAPLRFLYVSGSAGRDPARPHPKDSEMWMPASMVEYSKMRGETATLITDLAAQSGGAVEVCVAKPGFITGGQRGIMRGLFGAALWLTGLVETIDVREVSAALVYHAVNGFEGLDGRLLNAEMVKQGREELSGKGKL